MRVRHPSALIVAITTALLLVAGCSQKSENSDSPQAGHAESAAVDSAGESIKAGPDIGGVVAPGVAFTYDYAFTLPAKAISGVQREHAAACEKLGTSRCRVTGMRYEQPREDEVVAKLDFLLAPDLAHRFGSEGIAAVEAADGKVDNASVNGEDTGGAIVLSQQNSATITAEVARLDARLNAGGLGKGERAELTQRVEALRAQLRDEEQVRRGKEASIASTPVSFAYSSQGLLGSPGSFGKAAGASLVGIEDTLAVMLLLAGYALPWLLLAAVAILLWRFIKAKRQLAELAAGAHSPAAAAGPASES
jgi:hypothetical protein